MNNIMIKKQEGFYYRLRWIAGLLCLLPSKGDVILLIATHSGCTEQYQTIMTYVLSMNGERMFPINAIPHHQRPIQIPIATLSLTTQC